jgi:polyhydroxybutyrate depolymerase
VIQELARLSLACQVCSNWATPCRNPLSTGIVAPMVSHRTMAAPIIALSCVVGCATQFSPALDSGVANGSGDMNTSSGSGSSGSQSSGGSSGSANSSGNSGASSGGNGGASTSSGGSGGNSGAGSNSGSGGTSSGDGGTGMISADGGQPQGPACPATSALPAGDTNATIAFGGTTRQYIVHVPTNYAGTTAVPLVLDYHGLLLTNTSELQQAAPHGYAAEADKEGFIVVYPNAVGAPLYGWDVSPCCAQSPRSVDDVGFSKALIAKIEGQVCIDSKRVYAVGFSMGGGMAMDMACNAADVIAAVAPAGFDLMDPSNNWPCQPSRPITVLSFRSTSDPVCPYNGGPTNPPNGLPITITFLGAVGTFQKWAQLDQCIGSPSTNSSLGTSDGTCQTYSQCAANVSVTLCTKQGGSHDQGFADVAWPWLKNYTLP